MGHALIYAGIAIGVAAIAGIMVYGTQNQQNYISPDAVAAPAALEGDVIPSNSGLAPVLNKEKWHADPFADEAAEVKAKLGM